MADLRDRHALDRWIIEDRIPDHLYSEIFADPQFATACYELSERMLRAAANDAALDGMVKDAGRYLSASLAVLLHFTGGLTLPRLKALCAQSGQLSPGRARAMLLYLQYLGYARALPRTARGETRRYAPTQALMQAFRRHLQAGVEAAALIEPATYPVAARLDEPGTLETFLRIQGDGFLATAMQTDNSSALIRVFVHRHAGMQLLHLMFTSAPDRSMFPPGGAIPISTAAAARRLRVSRPHLVRLLNDAEREGLLSRGADGSVILAEMARAAVRSLFATRLMGFLICAAKTVVQAAAPQGPPDIDAGQLLVARQPAADTHPLH